jgi:hypothetical protein
MKSMPINHYEVAAQDGVENSPKPWSGKVFLDQCINQKIILNYENEIK